MATKAQKKAAHDNTLRHLLNWIKREGCSCEGKDVQDRRLQHNLKKYPLHYWYKDNLEAQTTATLRIFLSQRLQQQPGKPGLAVGFKKAHDAFAPRYLRQHGCINAKGKLIGYKSIYKRKPKSRIVKLGCCLPVQTAEKADDSEIVPPRTAISGGQVIEDGTRSDAVPSPSPSPSPSPDPLEHASEEGEHLSDEAEEVETTETAVQDTAGIDGFSAMTPTLSPCSTPAYTGLPRDTLQPGQSANPYYRIWGLSGSNVRREAGLVMSGVRIAAYSYIEQAHVDTAANAVFVPSPDAALGKLYQDLFAASHWESRLLALHNAEETFFPKQSVVLEGLLGAAVNRFVFKAEKSWILEPTIVRDANPDMRRIGEGILNDANFPSKSFSKYASWQATCDNNFLNNTIEPYAYKLAQKKAVAMKPYLDLLKLSTASQPLYAESWLGSLEPIFKDALILKQRLDATEYSEYETVWPQGGGRYVETMHGSTSGRALHQVSLAIFPGIKVTYRTGNVIYESKVRVVGPRTPLLK